MRHLALLLGLLGLVGVAHADDAKTAADVTEPGRTLERAVDVALRGEQVDAGKRTLVFLVDATPSLRTAGFARVLEQALAKAAAAGGLPTLALGVVGDKAGFRVKPTDDPAEVLAGVREILERPTDAFRNVYADVRQVAGLLARRSGGREIVLVALENGDGEDDVDGTAATLRRLRVRCSCITREAFLADSFYVSSTRQLPRGVEPGAGDAPYVTLPWGWLFQQVIANETTASGYAHYGLTRLAAASGGRVFLYATPTGGHHCAVFGSCPFCADDHQPTDEAFRAHRVAAVAPPATARSEAGAAMARDPWFRAVLSAWEAASKAGLLRSRPSVRLAGGGVRGERRRLGNWAPLLGNASGFSSRANRAEKLAVTCDRIRLALESDMAKIEADEGTPRYRAFADFTRAMLVLTRTNLVAFAAWCRDVAPKLLGKSSYEIEPPELEPLVDGRRVSGISYTPLCLCHGVKPFRALHLPGGEEFQSELTALDEVVSAFMRRHAHTPYAMALRHQGIARFHFTYLGTGTTVVKPKTGSMTENPTTETGRPNRGGGTTGSTGTGGATTGGG